MQLLTRLRPAGRPFFYHLVRTGTLCALFLQMGAASSAAEVMTALWPRSGAEALKAGDGVYLGNMDWSTGHATAQGVAYIRAGSDPEGPDYWRAAVRARSQALFRLRSLLTRVAARRGAALDNSSLERAVSRSVVSDRDYDPASGQIVLTVAVALYGRLGALANARTAGPRFYTPYSHEQLPSIIAVGAPVTQAPAPVSVVYQTPVPPPMSAPAPVSLPASTGPLLGTPPGQEGPFTGVVIDCRQLGVLASPSPKIRRTDGLVVWGDHVKADHDFVQAVGIAGFLEDFDRASSYEKRVGKHPLILRAVGCAGGPWKSDAVLNEQDAALLLREDGRAHFLDQFHVMFVVDPLAQ